MKSVLWPFVFNLSNGIIGVSILAMPFCFSQCGIVLGAIFLLLSNLATRLSCHMIITGSFLAKRNSYESFAFGQLGSLGKLTVELFTVLFLLSTLVAFFVVIGDLGPNVVANFIPFMSVNSTSLRPLIMVLMAASVITPLSLLRGVKSLSRISSVAFLFYIIFAVRMALAALTNLFSSDWIAQVYWWRPAGIVESLPIFALSLSCQTQLFCIFDAIPDPTPTKMDEIVSRAVNLCSLVYLTVGVFGYVAFFDQHIPGDILMLFDPTSISTRLLKCFFLLSVAVGYPIMIFPCRASIYSLLCKQGFATAFHGDLSVATTEVPSGPFKLITVVLIVINLAIALVCPNVEVVLSLTGSLIGSIICFILPGYLYLSVTPTSWTSTRYAAKAIILAALFLLIVCTFGTMSTSSDGVDTPSAANKMEFDDPITIPPNLTQLERLKSRRIRQTDSAEDLFNLTVVRFTMTECKGVGIDS